MNNETYPDFRSCINFSIYYKNVLWTQRKVVLTVEELKNDIESIQNLLKENPDSIQDLLSETVTVFRAVDYANGMAEDLKTLKDIVKETDTATFLLKVR